jgi:hypothetical protein
MNFNVSLVIVIIPLPFDFSQSPNVRQFKRPGVVLSVLGHSPDTPA